MKTKIWYRYRINYGQGQVGGFCASLKEVTRLFNDWSHGGSFIEEQDADTGEWFPIS